MQKFAFVSSYTCFFILLLLSCWNEVLAAVENGQIDCYFRAWLAATLCRLLESAPKHTSSHWIPSSLSLARSKCKCTSALASFLLQRPLVFRVTLKSSAISFTALSFDVKQGNQELGCSWLETTFCRLLSFCFFKSNSGWRSNLKFWAVGRVLWMLFRNHLVSSARPETVH